MPEPHPAAAAVYEKCPRCKRAIRRLADGTLKPHKVWARLCEPDADEIDPNEGDAETCPDCGLPNRDTPTRRDERHDHCGPLPHTGPVGGPYCERCE